MCEVLDRVEARGIEKKLNPNYFVCGKDSLYE